MSLRTKLLLLALLTLVLPVTGGVLVRQLEALLREGQAQVQLASAEMLARAVTAQAQDFPDAGPSFFVQEALAPLMVDGYDSDWRNQSLLQQVVMPTLHVALAHRENQLYAFISVNDSTPIRADAHWPQANHADHLIVTLEDDKGIHSLRLASAAPGPLVSVDMSRSGAPRIHGEWQESLKGYRAELRFPIGYQPRRLGVDVTDFHDPASAPRHIGTQGQLSEGRWPVQQAPQTLQALMNHLTPDGMRATLTQNDGWILARAGHLPESATQEPITFVRRLTYRLLAPGDTLSTSMEDQHAQLKLPELSQALSDRPAINWYDVDGGQGLLLASAVPIRIDGQVRGALLLERPAEALLLSGQALTGLMLATVITMFVIGLGLFAFAGRLSARIGTLSRAAERAIARGGQEAANDFHPSQARDELGDLSRSFGRLLEEISAYSGYLKGLAGTLSHELHTPIAVVRSSLENLESEPLPPSSRTYLERARTGVDRLAAIVRAMSESSRMERAIASAEAENFDLRALISECAEGYRALLESRNLQTMLPPMPVPFVGAPDLIVQALDKLIDNAKSFCPPEGWVLIGLARTPNGIEILVANAGPTLPANMEDRLFDSLVSLRGKAQRSDNHPHLGFGLHVVRLIAQRHGGYARAANLSTGQGVEFRLVLKGMPKA